MTDSSMTNALMRKLVQIEQMIRINGKDLLSTAECAFYLGVTACHVRHMASDRKIPYYKRNGKLYFSKSELEQWIKTERIPADFELKQIVNKLY